MLFRADRALRRFGAHGTIPRRINTCDFDPNSPCNMSTYMFVGLKAASFHHDAEKGGGGDFRERGRGGVVGGINGWQASNSEPVVRLLTKQPSR